MNFYFLNGLRTYSFKGKQDVVSYIQSNNTILVAVNAEKIMRSDDKLKALINKNTGYADGVGAVWALKKKGFRGARKIPGVELWFEIVKTLNHSHSFYFIGSTTEVIKATITKLKIEFPAINIKGYRNGFFNEGDIDKLKEELKNLKPQIVFVAMGSPKQEYLMQDLFAFHEAVYQGLGGSFDVYTGKVKRAPDFFLKLGLEWFYRLLKQPARFGRQLILVKFFWRFTIGKI
ncbi:MAG: WecB/TagA/CpsF family glycosyltransferase [Bacteroidia bacterium]|nr:WecB/TagA/CpsF family glycosyltransferase [Bacteroidia bacterium]